MFYRKKNSYEGRWIVRLIEAGLIFGIVLFGLDALANLFAPQDAIIIHTQPVTYDISPQVNSTFTADDYYNLGLDQHMRDNYYEAIGYYTRALNANPEHPSSMLNRGVAYEQLQQSQRAMMDYNAFMNRSSAQHVSASIHFDDYYVEVPMVENRVYEFSFYGQAGDVINVSAIGTDSFGYEDVDPLMVLVAPDGTVIAGDDDTLRSDGSLINVNPSLENITLTTDGAYTLRLSHAGGETSGIINLQFDKNEKALIDFNFGGDDGYYGCDD